MRILLRRETSPGIFDCDIDRMAATRTAGFSTIPARGIDGYRRCHGFDQVGNRVELIESVEI
jgi:hypothetical protein